MELRPLGRSGLLVSALGLGTNNFGFLRPNLNVDTIVNSAVDCGITLFDTADVYGDGESERLLGKALGARRHEVLIATKWGIPFGLPPGEANPPYPIRRGSRDFILKAVEGSLRRLGTDYIDLYQLHLPDTDTPIDETLRTLQDLIRAGKIRYIGLSNVSAWQLAEANVAARCLGVEPFVSVQSEYSLLRRELVEPDLAFVAQRHGAGLIPYFPLASGLLSGKHSASGYAAGSRLADLPVIAQRFGSERNWQIVAALENFARERGFTLLELAFAWLLHRPPVASVIAGATSTDQIISNAAVIGRWQMTSEDIAEIDKITGVPVGLPTH